MELAIGAGAILTVVSTIPYIVGVLKGNLKPKIVSWFTWCLLSMLLTGAALAEGQTMSAVMSGFAAFATGMVVVLSLKHGNRGLDKLDIACLAGAMAGIAIWLMLDNPALAIVVAIAIDVVAFVPTLVHGWKSPGEESLIGFAIATVAAGLGLFAAVLSGAAVIGLAYPTYAVTFNGMMAMLLVRGPWLEYLDSLRPAMQEEPIYNDEY